MKAQSWRERIRDDGEHAAEAHAAATEHEARIQRYAEMVEAGLILFEGGRRPSRHGPLRTDYPDDRPRRRKPRRK